MLPLHQSSSHATIMFPWVPRASTVPQDWRYCLCLTLPWGGGVRRDPKVFIKQCPRTESNCAGVSTCCQTSPISYQPCEIQRILRIWSIDLTKYSRTIRTNSDILMSTDPIPKIREEMLSLQLHEWRFLLQLPSISYSYYAPTQSKLWRCNRITR
jgi:hypothetical protein